LPRLKEGGIDLEVFAIWVNPNEYVPHGSYDQANKMIDALEDICTRASEIIAIPRTFDDLLINDAQGKISAMIGIEGGHPLENSLDKLQHFYDRGMRYLGITWNNSTDWATSAKDEISGKLLPFRGLTEFGKDVIKKCNELGVIIDVSHCGEKTFYDILETTVQPIIASHSSVYNICPHFRNLNDAQLMAIKENGGVVFVNYYPAYIDSTFEKRADQVLKKHEQALDSLKELYNEESDDYWYKSQDIIYKDLAAVAPSLDQLIDHIDYIVNLLGVDYVGLGSDFDGVEVLPRGLEDCSKIPAITKKLFERGYSKESIRKILGENFKRVFRQVVG
ncbi:MAG: dipeptidase, partial [Candidatus Marinimicrobia bacterium]|nr:dipeptidase [Candidatus Neomarinimicrobiota bacterium]